MLLDIQVQRYPVGIWIGVWSSGKGLGWSYQLGSHLCVDVFNSVKLGDVMKKANLEKIRGQKTEPREILELRGQEGVEESAKENENKQLER